MKRYATTKRKLDKSGVEVYRTTYYPQILVSDDDKFIYPKDGDRLDTLAYKYYGDTTLWWVIARANGEFNGDLRPKIGRRITIPTDISDSIRELNNLNSSRE